MKKPNPNDHPIIIADKIDFERSILMSKRGKLNHKKGRIWRGGKASTEIDPAKALRMIFCRKSRFSFVVGPEK